MASLTEDQWRALLPWLKRMKPHSLKAAHAVLVGGESLRVAAVPYGLQHQHVHRSVNRVLAWHRRVRENISLEGRPLAAGWVTVCFDLPKSRVREARRLIESLKSEYLAKERKPLTRRSPDSK